MNRFVYGLIFSWVDLFDAVVCVLTFGMYNPCNAISFAGWFAKYKIKSRKQGETK